MCPSRPILLSLAILLSVALALPAVAGSKKFLKSNEAKETDEPQRFLADYDKLIEGKEADWVYFPPEVDLKLVKTVTLDPFGATGKRGHATTSRPFRPETRRLGGHGRK